MTTIDSGTDQGSDQGTNPGADVPTLVSGLAVVLLGAVLLADHVGALDLHFGVNVDVKEKIEAGERFDVDRPQSRIDRAVSHCRERDHLARTLVGDVVKQQQFDPRRSR